MRDLTSKDKIEQFMRLLGRRVRDQARVYFTGGSTAVLHGWRDSTVDIDLYFKPESDDLFRALSELKETLQINIELASPPDFIPTLPGWEDRSVFIGREGKLDFFNYDLYSQALSKIERGHQQDLSDVQNMLASGLVEHEKLLSLFETIKSDIYKYPAIDPATFSRAVRGIVDSEQKTKKEK
jgi:hypothetical protein